MPAANWEHPCWYFFVDAASGTVRRFDASTPPRMLPELLEITHGRDNPPAGMSEESLAHYSEILRQLPKPAPTRGQAYAFIISGGADQSNNHIRYWNDCAFIYRTLVQYYGYAHDHIRVCMSDGTNPAVDRSDGTNSPTDLDGNGTPTSSTRPPCSTSARSSASWPRPSPQRPALHLHHRSWRPGVGSRLL